MNKRLTPKDRNLIKSAVTRAFARSELHKQVLSASIIQHNDPERPRVKTWALCAVCKVPEAKSYMQVDHIVPKVPLDSALEYMTWDELVDRTWCDPLNLQTICRKCHNEKTKIEKQIRKEAKKRLKLVA